MNLDIRNDISGNHQCAILDLMPFSMMDYDVPNVKLSCSPDIRKK